MSATAWLSNAISRFQRIINIPVNPTAGEVAMKV
jgi:hypothetical protein